MSVLSDSCLFVVGKLRQDSGFYPVRSVVSSGAIYMNKGNTSQAQAYHRKTVRRKIAELHLSISHSLH